MVHKTSRVLPEEAEGFDAAANEQAIDTVEILTVRRSFSRVFREGTYPPLRGTFIELQKTSGLLYLKGSVDFFRTFGVTMHSRIGSSSNPGSEPEIQEGATV